MGSAAAWLFALATAEPHAPALRWDAPAGCPTHDDVATLLAAQGSSTDGDRRFATEATVRETAAGRWAVTISITSDAGEIHRELELDSCAAAAEAVALVYGLALAGESEPVHDEPAPPPVDAPSVVVPPAVAVPDARGAAITSDRSPVSPPPSQPDRRAPRPPQLVIHVDGGGGVGTLNRGGGHVLLGAGVAWRRVRLGLRVDHAIVRQSIRASVDVGANISATTGGLEASVPIPLGRIELLPGLDLRAGGLRAHGVGGRRGVTRWVPWVVVAGGMTLVWRVTDIVGLRVGAAVEVPLVRHTFAFDDLEIVQTRAVGGLFVAGVEIRAPRRPR